MEKLHISTFSNEVSAGFGLEGQAKLSVNECHLSAAPRGSEIQGCGRLRQDDFGIETRVGHVARLCLKSKQINPTLNLETPQRAAQNFPFFESTFFFVFCLFVCLAF